MDVKLGCFFPLLILASLVSLSSSAPKLNLSAPLGKYRILMLLPFASESHRNCFLPLAETLADRGHEVIILSPLPPKSKHPKVKELNHAKEDLMAHSPSMFEIRETDASMGFSIFKYILPKIAQDMYDNPAVMDLYNRRKDFDLFIIDELFNEVAYPFLEGSNFITIATAGVLPSASATLGNVLNPSYTPSIMSDYPRPYSLFQRMKNIFETISMALYWRNFEIFPSIQEVLWKRFPNLPPLAEIEKGLSMSLVNTHFSLDIPIPLLPSQVEVGGMHCHPGTPLPKDLEAFIEGSGSEGVIYFSLGSVCKGNTIPEKYKKILIETFSKLKQRVIWKFEDEMQGLPNNIIIKKWLPQQDILAHPKVKLFITHGGLLSMQEALFHATPLLALPIFGDQERNAQRIKNKGFGTFLFWENLTVDLLHSTIENLIRDPKYMKTVKSVSVSFRDQQNLPLEKAVWWTEYAIRHKGTPQLKSPGASLGWIEYLNIDVIIAIHIAIFVLFKILKMLVKTLLSFCFSKSKPEKKKKA